MLKFVYYFSTVTYKFQNIVVFFTKPPTWKHRFVNPGPNAYSPYSVTTQLNVSSTLAQSDSFVS